MQSPQEPALPQEVISGPEEVHHVEEVRCHLARLLGPPYLTIRRSVTCPSCLARIPEARRAALLMANFHLEVSARRHMYYKVLLTKGAHKHSQLTSLEKDIALFSAQVLLILDKVGVKLSSQEHSMVYSESPGLSLIKSSLWMG